MWDSPNPVPWTNVNDGRFSGLRNPFTMAFSEVARADLAASAFNADMIPFNPYGVGF